MIATLCSSITKMKGRASSKGGPVLWKFEFFARIHFEPHRDFSKEPGIISLCLSNNISVRGPVEFSVRGPVEFVFSSCSLEFRTTATIKPPIISTQADIMCFPSYKPYFHLASYAVWHVQHKSQWNIASVIFNSVFWLSSRQHELFHIHLRHSSVTSATIIASANTGRFVPAIITAVIRAVQGTYFLKTKANIQSLSLNEEIYWTWQKCYYKSLHHV